MKVEQVRRGESEVGDTDVQKVPFPFRLKNASGYLSLAKPRTIRSQKVCDNCQKPLPDEDSFRKTVIRCLKEGFHILDDGAGTKEGPHCVCKDRIITRLYRLRNQRSRVKRKMAFIAKVPRDERKSKRFLLQRGDKPKDRSKQKALQRQMHSEDLVLWDWELFDEKGKPHRLEDVLDTPLLRQIINAKFSTESLAHLDRILSQLATDESFVTTATDESEPSEREETWPDLEVLWRKRLDDEE